MKKLIVALMILVFSFALLNAVPGKYDDAKKMAEKQIGMLQAFVEGADAVKDAKGAAALIRSFAKGLKESIPQMVAMAKKYKNFEDMMKKDTPEELKDVAKKAEEWGNKMQPAFMKLMSYMGDPEVQKAQQEMAAVGMEVKKAMDEATGKK